MCVGKSFQKGVNKRPLPLGGLIIKNKKQKQKGKVKRHDKKRNEGNYEGMGNKESEGKRKGKSNVN